jgi:CBS domain containing-hemolysin-like protein
MNPLQWSKSPVAVALCVSAVTAFAVLFHKTAQLWGLTNPVVVTDKVTAFLTLAGVAVTAGASLIGFIARVRSKIQPLTFSQAAADAAKTSTTQALQAINEAAERTPEPGLVLPPSVIAAVTSAAASVPPKQPEPQQT